MAEEQASFRPQRGMQNYRYSIPIIVERSITHWQPLFDALLKSLRYWFS